MFQGCFKEVSRKFQESLMEFKKVSMILKHINSPSKKVFCCCCCLAVVAASRAEGGLVKNIESPVSSLVLRTKNFQHNELGVSHSKSKLSVPNQNVI